MTMPMLPPVAVRPTAAPAGPTTPAAGGPPADATVAATDGAPAWTSGAAAPAAGGAEETGESFTAILAALIADGTSAEAPADSAPTGPTDANADPASAAAPVGPALTPGPPVVPTVTVPGVEDIAEPVPGAAVGGSGSVPAPTAVTPVAEPAVPGAVPTDPTPPTRSGLPGTEGALPAASAAPTTGPVVDQGGMESVSESPRVPTQSGVTPASPTAALHQVGAPQVEGTGRPDTPVGVHATVPSTASGDTPVATPPVGQPPQPVASVTSAATVDSPPPPPAPSSPPASPAQQIALHVTPLRRAPNGVHRMTVHLHPAELGPVSLVAEVRDTGIHLHLSGATEAGREALRAALGDLRRELQQAGFVNCSLDLRQETPSGGAPFRSDTRTVVVPSGDHEPAAPIPDLPRPNGTHHLDLHL